MLSKRGEKFVLGLIDDLISSHENSLSLDADLLSKAALREGSRVKERNLQPEQRSYCLRIAQELDSNRGAIEALEMLKRQIKHLTSKG